MKIIFLGVFMNNLDEKMIVRELKIRNLIKISSSASLIFGEFFDKGADIIKIIKSYLENLGSLNDNLVVDSTIQRELEIANLISFAKNGVFMETNPKQAYVIRKRLYDYTNDSIQEYENTCNNTKIM